ncbi:MAG TPA: DUF262 domain-containing protein [Moraxellaceae bacterium]|nr:DUF262 domain-containing protein [Moraxellaceae bacterium]
MTTGTLPIDAPPPEGCTLDHKTIGDLRGVFFVPSYQRGYRWGPEDVRRLLDDIWESAERDYSLQPIVLKLHQAGSSAATEEWELIDGQQRLTTLYLVFQYIHKAWGRLGAPFSLHYQTRSESGAYLRSMGSHPEQDLALSGRNIDYSHLYNSYQAVAEWFRGKGNDSFEQERIASKLRDQLCERVRIIWYQAPASTSSTDLFTRLNVGRIPLTDAELVKAALLSRIRTSASIDRAHEIAAQWDSIERDLHRPDIWSFVAGRSPDAADTDYPTRISLLLDALADHKAGTPAAMRPRYYTFDTLRGDIEHSPLEFWQRVVALHAQVIGWFGHATLYNKIGFLADSAPRAGEFAVIARAAQGKRKSEFEAYLVTRIRDRLDIGKDNLDDPRYDRSSDRVRLHNLLLMMNVEATSRTGQHFPFHRHLGVGTWSLEHIHAQNAESLKKAEQWRAWLDLHDKALDAVRDTENAAAIDRLKCDIRTAVGHIREGNAKAFSGNEFAALSHRILQFLNRDAAPDHSIRNLALLSSHQNSKLNNSVFEVKRQLILELDRTGEYVPACTRNVFLKYYAEADAQQPHFWSEQDKKAYFKAMADLLKEYLK